MSKIRHNMRLPHDETNEAKRYNLADPDALAGLQNSAHFAVYSEHRALTREEATALLSLAQSYMALTTYELGQECCVGKLRDIWRARRAPPVGCPRTQDRSAVEEVGEVDGEAMRRFFTAIHHLVAHPLLLTGAGWATRFHDWTARRMS